MAIEKSSLGADLDNFFRALLREASPDAQAPADPDAGTLPDEKPALGFRDRLDLFKAGVAYMSVKNKLDDGSGKEKSDEFGKLQRGYSRGAGRGRSGAAAANGATEQ
jgi:hypothetical protein